MQIQLIRTEADYKHVMKEIESLMLAKAGSLDGDRLDILVTLVEAYENKHRQFEFRDPVATIKLHVDKPPK